MTITNKGKPESRKRKLSDADPQASEEETTAVTPKTPVANKKKNKQKNKKAQKSQKSKAVQEDNSNADPQTSEEGTTVAPEKPVANKKKNKKAQKSQKSKAVHKEPQVADEDNSEDEGTNAGISTQRLKETPKSKSGSGSAASSKDADRRDERDRRTLFLKNLPGICTIRHIKALSKDIKQVRLRSTFSVIDNKRTRIGFAYVAFASEEAAEKNFKTLEAALVKGSKIKVDYVGTKSKFQSTKSKTEPGTANIDPLRLYVSGLPGDTTQEDILKLFPGAVEVVLPKRNKDKLLFGYGFVGFADADLAAQHHDRGQDLTLKGRKLVVLYARNKTGDSGKTSEKKQKEKGAKVAEKQEVKMEQDDDDDEEADDDEDDDEDDDDDDEEEDDE